MPGLDPGIYVFLSQSLLDETWMAGTSPALTQFREEINAIFSPRGNALSDQLAPRRSAPWNGSTHPGYSGGRALT
jgi:hypothetical protein